MLWRQVITVAAVLGAVATTSRLEAQTAMVRSAAPAVTTSDTSSLGSETWAAERERMLQLMQRDMRKLQAPTPRVRTAAYATAGRPTRGCGAADGLESDARASVRRRS
jgi:hypothetical protein